MSDLIPFGFDLLSAVEYNEKNAEKVGWYDQIPKDAKAAYPCLGHDPVEGSYGERERFAVEVLEYQTSVFPEPTDHDGKLGKGTWISLLKDFDPIPDKDSFLLWKDRRHPVQAQVISCETNPPGYDLHKAGNFSRRKSPIRLVVLHWGSSTVKNLYDYFSSTGREVSTHFGVGPSGSYQMLDLEHKAWHAGYVNKFAVGIDICQQPTRSYLNYYQNKSYDVAEANNPTNRGPVDIITLEPQTAKHTRELVFGLCNVLDIPLRVPRSADGSMWHGVLDDSILRDGRFQGVVGHHHISETKWDIACWWDTVFGGTELG